MVDCIKKTEKPEDFYFNNEEKVFKKCEISCEKCEGKANRCLKCASDFYKFPFNDNIVNVNNTITNTNETGNMYLNCVKNCPKELIENKETLTCKKIK